MYVIGGPITTENAPNYVCPHYVCTAVHARTGVVGYLAKKCSKCYHVQCICVSECMFSSVCMVYVWCSGTPLIQTPNCKHTSIVDTCH